MPVIGFGRRPNAIVSAALEETFDFVLEAARSESDIVAEVTRQIACMTYYASGKAYFKLDQMRPTNTADSLRH